MKREKPYRCCPLAVSAPFLSSCLLAHVRFAKKRQDKLALPSALQPVGWSVADGDRALEVKLIRTVPKLTMNGGRGFLPTETVSSPFSQQKVLDDFAKLLHAEGEN